MGKKYIVKFDRDGCIGAAACVSMDPDDWVLSKEDGKAILAESKWDEGDAYWTRQIDESELDRMLTAAKSCPVVVIHIFSEDGEQLV
jgi:ferredoxin